MSRARELLGLIGSVGVPEAKQEMVGEFTYNGYWVRIFSTPQGEYKKGVWVEQDPTFAYSFGTGEKFDKKTTVVAASKSFPSREKAEDAARASIDSEGE